MLALIYSTTFKWHVNLLVNENKSTIEYHFFVASDHYSCYTLCRRLNQASVSGLVVGSLVNERHAFIDILLGVSSGMVGGSEATALEPPLEWLGALSQTTQMITTETTTDLADALCKGLAHRLLLHKLKHGTKRAMKIEIEYLLGADKALTAVGMRIPPAMQMCLVAGRSILTIPAYSEMSSAS